MKLTQACSILETGYARSCLSLNCLSKNSVYGYCMLTRRVNEREKTFSLFVHASMIIIIHTTKKNETFFTLSSPNTEFYIPFFQSKEYCQVLNKLSLSLSLYPVCLSSPFFFLPWQTFLHPIALPVILSFFHFQLFLFKLVNFPLES